MELKLVKQGQFLGTTCDFYQDENNKIFMNRLQIGQALQYKKPKDAIYRIHKRHEKELKTHYVIERLVDKVSTYHKEEEMFLYDEKGIFAIIRFSTTKVANDYFDWVYDTIQEIKMNGYYIATAKDESWLGIRTDGKNTRKEEIEEIKAFVEYAKLQGSSKPNWYYKHFTNLVRGKLNIPKNLKRDDMSQKQLRDIMSLETIICMKLPKLINGKMHYKEIYNKIKELIEQI